MSSVELRPPLPEQLPHRDVLFVLPDLATTLSPAILSAIASAIAQSLPPGDFTAQDNGTIIFRTPLSAWSKAAREEALERAPSQ